MNCNDKWIIEKLYWQQTVTVRNCQKYIYKDERCVDLTEITFRDQKTSGKVLCTFHLFVCLRIMDYNMQMEDKINAFEMWIFRCMFRILHLDRKTNVELLEMVKAKQTLLSTVQERIYGYM